MTTPTLLATLEEQGVALTVCDGRLRLEGPEEVLTADLEDEARVQKEELLQIITLRALPTPELIARLRDMGCVPRLDERGKFKMARPALHLRELVETRRYVILDFLRSETGLPPFLHPELTVLVDLVGRQQQWLAAHAHEWTDDEWEQRKKALLDNLDRMEAGLEYCGHTVQRYGWTIEAQGQWHRISDGDEGRDGTSHRTSSGASGNEQPSQSRAMRYAVSSLLIPPDNAIIPK